MLYNDENILEGKYNCLSESRAGIEVDRIHVELLNQKVPVGADYVRKHESGMPRDGYNAPTLVDTSNKSVGSIKSFVIYCSASITTLSNSQLLATSTLFHIRHFQYIKFSFILLNTIYFSSHYITLTNHFI